MSHLTHIEHTGAGFQVSPALSLQGQLTNGGLQFARYDMPRIKREIDRDAFSHGPASTLESCRSHLTRNCMHDSSHPIAALRLA